MTTGGTGGGNFRGVLELGNFKVAVWTYGGRYDAPQTGNSTQYIVPDYVIARASRGRLAATFGDIPKFSTGAQVPLGLPRRMSSRGSGMDIMTNAYTDASGKSLFVEGGARPLMIPTAIDSFARLHTIA